MNGSIRHAESQFSFPPVVRQSQIAARLQARFAWVQRSCPCRFCLLRLSSKSPALRARATVIETQVTLLALALYPSHLFIGVQSCTRALCSGLLLCVSDSELRVTFSQCRGVITPRLLSSSWTGVYASRCKSQLHSFLAPRGALSGLNKAREPSEDKGTSKSLAW